MPALCRCKADIRNPLSLLAHERSRFATCQWELLTPTDISIPFTHRLVLYALEAGECLFCVQTLHNLIVTTLIFYYTSIPHSFLRFLSFSLLCFFLVLLYSMEYAQFKRTFFVFSAIFQTKKAHGSLHFLPCTFKNYLSVLIFTRCILPYPLFWGISM